MVGEATTKSHVNRRTFWAYTYGPYLHSAAIANQPRTLLTDYDKCVSIGGAGGSNPCKEGWGSYHAVIQFLMCDGAVRSVPREIDMTVFCGLATIAGRETVQLSP